ncbi:hypothetical protein MAJ_04718, partial [Metarhizium majus ARSEF 297]
MQFSVLATVVAAALFSSVAQGCTPGKRDQTQGMCSRFLLTSPTFHLGKTECVSVNDQNGNRLCNGCAIAIGDPNGRCITNNYCEQRDNSCTTINGSPYCI